MKEGTGRREVRGVKEGRVEGGGNEGGEEGRRGYEGGEGQ